MPTCGSASFCSLEEHILCHYGPQATCPIGSASRDFSLLVVCWFSGWRNRGFDKAIGSRTCWFYKHSARKFGPGVLETEIHVPRPRIMRRPKDCVDIALTTVRLGSAYAVRDFGCRSPSPRILGVPVAPKAALISSSLSLSGFKSSLPHPPSTTYLLHAAFNGTMVQCCTPIV